MPSTRICTLALLMFSTVLLGESPERQPDTVVVDFEKEFTPVPPSAAGARISGAIPPPLIDDSAWADLELIYSPETKTAFSGKQSLRLQASNISKGWAQLVLPGISLDREHFVKVSVAFLAPNAMKATVVLRKRK